METAGQETISWQNQPHLGLFRRLRLFPDGCTLRNTAGATRIASIGKGFYSEGAYKNHETILSRSANDFAHLVRGTPDGSSSLL